MLDEHLVAKMNGDSMEVLQRRGTDCNLVGARAAGVEGSNVDYMQEPLPPLLALCLRKNVHNEAQDCMSRNQMHARRHAKEWLREIIVIDELNAGRQIAPQ